MKEDFYHGGLFACMNGWKVKPHTASGDRYSDIYIEDADHEIGIIHPQLSGTARYAS